jgi:hypothetical protein
MVMVPPFAGMVTDSLTQALAVLALFEHEEVQDSSHAESIVLQAVSEQNRTLPRSAASYAV